MLLHDLMDDAVAGVTADLPALSAESRRRGAAVRRRRRAVAAIGSVSAAAVLAGGTYALAPGPSDNSTAANDAHSVAVHALSGDTAPITSRGIGAALADAVEDVADGRVSHIQGDDFYRDALAALLLQPDATDGPAGQIMLNLQPPAVAGDPPYACAEYLVGSITDCTSRTLPNGDVLRTYREDGDTEIGPRSQRLVAEVISPGRRVRVIVSAVNTNPWDSKRYRDRPVLTRAQLTEIATLPWWSLTELPVEYVEAGKLLDGYRDADAGS